MSLSLGAGVACLAFDVGGTSIKSGFVDVDGQLHDVRRTATPSGPGVVENLMATLAELQSSYTESHGTHAAAIGLSVPGLVRERDGVALYSANLGWRNLAIVERAEAALGRPVSFSHDVRAAAVAEAKLGAGRDSRNLLCVIIGTGIASAIVLDGVPYSGNGGAGEIGHGGFSAEGPECDCGSRGCLENVASAGAMVRRYQELGGSALTGTEELLSRAAAGDRLAQDTWDTAVGELATALSGHIALLSPDTIVFGGGVARAGEQLMAPIRERLEASLGILPRPALQLAELGDDAGLIGTALIARANAEAEGK